MSWKYIQDSGWLLHDGVQIAQGYAGNAEGLNNPGMQNVKDVGPLPCGWYTLGPMVDDHPKLGKRVIPLIPDADTELFGRDDFFMHGDRIDAVGQHLASDGCIIFELATRETVDASGERRLQVVATLQDWPNA